MAQQAMPGWYAQALRGVLSLEASDVARLEARLAADPEDLEARVQLIGYHGRTDRAGLAEDRAERVRLVLWMIEHHPELAVAQLGPGELTGDEYGRAAALWDAAVRARPGDAVVARNAAGFFAGRDAERHLRYLEAAVAVDPSQESAVRGLASLYAMTVLEGGPLAERAVAGLAASRNVWILGNAAYMFQSQYNRGLQMGTPDVRAKEWAERTFERARAIDPGLDRAAILPQVDMDERRRVWAEEEARRAEAGRQPDAVERIRRMGVEAFPELPAAVAGVLRSRGCQVPQSRLEGPGRNVVRGEFFAAGEMGWAVLCSVGRRTTLLAFRNDRDMEPAAVTVHEDDGYVAAPAVAEVGYAYDLSVVGRDYIVTHHRAYGGPEPPATIDHQGIDEGFLEKASVVWYSYQGAWLRLQGAD